MREFEDWRHRFRQDLTALRRRVQEDAAWSERLRNDDTGEVLKQIFNQSIADGEKGLSLRAMLAEATLETNRRRVYAPGTVVSKMLLGPHARLWGPGAALKTTGRLWSFGTCCSGLERKLGVRSVQAASSAGTWGSRARCLAHAGVHAGGRWQSAHVCPDRRDGSNLGRSTERAEQLTGTVQTTPAAVVDVGRQTRVQRDPRRTRRIPCGTGRGTTALLR
jgi:hypothetical protein